MRPYRLSLAFALLLSAAHWGPAGAVVLGEARSGAAIGHPLNFTASVSAAPEEANNLCVEAEVFQGGERMRDDQTRARWEPGAQGQALVRVQTTVAIEEPVVIVEVHVGCSSRITRKYVLLAREPGPAQAPAAAAQPDAPIPASAARSRAPAPSQGKPAPVAAAVPKEQAKPPAPVAGSEQPAPRVAAAGQVRQEAGAVEAPGSLRLKATVNLQSTEDTALRGQAAALRLAFNATPEDGVRNVQRMHALGSELQTLQAQTRKSTGMLEQLRQEVEEAEGARNTRTLAASAFGVLLAVTMAGLWWARRSNRRLLGHRAAARPVSDLESDFPSGLFSGRTTRPTVPPVRAPVQGPAPAAPATPRPMGRPMAAHSRWPADLQGEQASTRLKAEELVDVQQQADFFLSLGQTDAAIEVLEAHLLQAGDSSPLAWLDLLEIYHGLDRRQGYERVRRTFRRHFKVQVPDFGQYRQAEARGLESYPQVVAAIAGAWGSPRVLEVIEGSLLRRPDQPDTGEALDLEAYRELVLLYNIARETGGLQPQKATRGDMAPAAAMKPSPSLATPPAKPAELPMLEFDVDGLPRPNGRK